MPCIMHLGKVKICNHHHYISTPVYIERYPRWQAQGRRIIKMHPGSSPSIRHASIIPKSYLIGTRPLWLLYFFQRKVRLYDPQGLINQLWCFTADFMFYHRLRILKLNTPAGNASDTFYP